MANALPTRLLLPAPTTRTLRPSSWARISSFTRSSTFSGSTFSIASDIPLRISPTASANRLMTHLHPFGSLPIS
jgi:hypothetical protein